MPLPRGTVGRHRNPVGGIDLREFLAKALIVFVLVVALGGLAVFGARHAAWDLVAARSMHPLSALDRLAQMVEEVPDERLERVRRDLHTIVVRTMPLIEEIRPVSQVLCGNGDQMVSGPGNEPL